MDTQVNRPTLSILIPVYNEGPSIGKVIRVLEALLNYPHEVVVIYDSEDDNTKPIAQSLQKEFKNFSLLKNKFGKGIINALKTGFFYTDSEVLGVYAGDDIGPTVAVNEMMAKMLEGYDLVSATRYSKGGRRYGGSLVNKIVSILGNRIFHLLTQFPLKDSTTGLKLYRRRVLNTINMESSKGGWVLAMEIAIKAYLKGFRLAEIPIISIDRIYGGKSQFQLGAWLPSYLKWFIYGVIEINRLRVKKFLENKR